MIRTSITPEQTEVSIQVPENYIGKQIEVLLYAVDELTENEIPKKKRLSDFKGKLNLSDAEYNDLQKHLKEIRNEWDRAI